MKWKFSFPRKEPRFAPWLFSLSWEQRKVSEIATFSKGTGYSKSDIRDKGTPLILYGRLYTKYETVIREVDTFAIPKDGSVYSRGGEVIIPASGETAEDISIASVVEKSGVILGGDLNIITPQSGIDSAFLALSISHGEAHRSLSKLAQGKSVVHIHNSDIQTVEVSIPELSEQESISQFFERVDTLITLHQRGANSWVRVRFRLFCSTTIFWEQRKFSELVLIERGGSPRPIDAFITDSPDGLNWIKIGDAPTQGKYITKTEEKIRPEGLSKTRVVQPGDLILSNSMSFGRPYIMGISGCIHDGWLLIRNTKEVFDLTFLCHLLGSGQMLEQYSTLAAGSTVNNLNKELVGSAIVKYPALEEQRKIGVYLERVDTLITLHQREFTHTNSNTNYVKYYQRNRPLLCVLRSMDKSV